MAFTDTERSFLLGLKDIGKTKEEALNILGMSRQKMQKIQTKKETTTLEKTGEVVSDIGTGLAKGAVQTLKGIGQVGEQEIIKPLGRLLTPKKFEKRLGFAEEEPTGAEFLFPSKEVLEAKTTGEKAGKFIEEVAEFAIPWAKIGSMTKGLSLMKRAIVEGITGAGVATAQEGEVGTGTAVAGVTGVILPPLGAGIKNLFRPERLISKALWLTPTQKKVLSEISSTKINKTPAYKDIDDFALKNNLKGSREEMVEQVRDLFTKSTEAKTGVLEAIKETTENTYDELLEYLIKKYDTPWQKAVSDRIIELQWKKILTAFDLNDIRRFADKTLPKNAYSDAEPVATEGVQKLIDPIRRRLEKLDKTGEIKKQNTDIRILFKLMKDLDQSAQRVLANQIFFRTAGRVIAGGGISMAIPWAQPLAVAAGLIEAATDIPQVASGLAQMLKNIPENQATKTLENIFKAILQKGTQEIAK